MERITATACVLLSLTGVSGQMTVGAGTNLHLDAGTSLRVESPMTWTLEAGSTVVNNGTIVLGPSSELSEAPGAAITGSGIERTTRDLDSPLNSNDPGGLGAILTTSTAPGPTLVERGHLPITAFNGETSIARWIRITPANNSGLGAMLAFRYDVQELGSVPETEQRLHVFDGQWNWWYLPSTVNTGSSTVTTTGLDSLGSFTTFAMDLPTGMSGDHTAGGYALIGPPGEQQFLSVPDGECAGSLDFIAASGAQAANFTPQWTGGLHALPRPALASGLYRLVVNGTRGFPLLVP